MVGVVKVPVGVAEAARSAVAAVLTVWRPTGSLVPTVPDSFPGVVHLEGMFSPIPARNPINVPAVISCSPLNPIVTGNSSVSLITS